MKMLRKIAGWVRLPDEPWEVTMRRMKMRVKNALLQYPIMWWTSRIAKHLWKFATRVKSAPFDSWISQTTKWKPQVIEDANCEYLPYRCIGRPYAKWDDVLNRFCHIHFNLDWQEVSIEAFSAYMDDFIEFHN